MQELLAQLLTDYPILAPLIFIGARSSAIFIPPIPGLVIDLIGVATFGPFFGFIYAEVGMFVGSALAFLLARRFREPLVARFAPLKKIHTWEEEVSERAKFWGFVGFRILTYAVYDYVSYAAGLTRFSFWKFSLATAIAVTPALIVVYFFGSVVFKLGLVQFTIFGAALLALAPLVARSSFAKKLLAQLSGKNRPQR